MNYNSKILKCLIKQRRHDFGSIEMKINNNIVRIATSSRDRAVDLELPQVTIKDTNTKFRIYGGGLTQSYQKILSASQLKSTGLRCYILLYNYMIYLLKNKKLSAYDLFEQSLLIGTFRNTFHAYFSMPIHFDRYTRVAHPIFKGLNVVINTPSNKRFTLTTFVRNKNQEEEDNTKNCVCINGRDISIDDLVYIIVNLENKSENSINGKSITCNCTDCIELL